jgi:hypothetical protein
MKKSTRDYKAGRSRFGNIVLDVKGKQQGVVFGVSVSKLRWTMS